MGVLFEVRSEKNGACGHVHVSGELDIATAPILESRLKEIDGDGSLDIIVDLMYLTFMDVSGLHSFLRAADRAGRSGRKFGIVNPAPIVRRILEITETTFLMDQPAVPSQTRLRQVIEQKDPIEASAK